MGSGERDGNLFEIAGGWVKRKREANEYVVKRGVPKWGWIGGELVVFEGSEKGAKGERTERGDGGGKGGRSNGEEGEGRGRWCTEKGCCLGESEQGLGRGWTWRGGVG